MTKVKKKVKVTSVKYLFCLKENNLSEIAEITLYGNYSRNKIEKLVKEKCIELDAYFTCILEIETKEEVFETTLDNFLNIATVSNK